MELVISHCNEDLSFLKLLDLNVFDQIILYRKNPECVDFFHSFDHVVKMLPNVGRCDHTYLTHIINRYDDLSDITVFVPGSCDIEMKFAKLITVLTQTLETKQSCALVHNVTDVRKHFEDFQLTEYDCMHHKNPKGVPMKLCEYRPFGKWWTMVFGDYLYDKVTYEGIFAIKREDILKRPKDFYQNLISFVDQHNNPEAGHYIERSWCAVFQL